MVTAAKRPKRPTAQQLEYELEDLRVALANANERLDVRDAQLAATLDSLRQVLGLVDRGGFAWPKEQNALRAAEALLAELSKERG